MKLANVPGKLWEHKKKSAFAAVLAYYIAGKTLRWKRDCDIRAVYAQQAKRFGDMPLAETERLRRVTVLVDAKSGSAFDCFSKNALPLLHLAGLKVDLIRATDRSQFEAVAGNIDTTECDALYIVGDDSALSAALTAIYSKNDAAAVPIGVFPGGSENKSLANLVPNVFVLQNDIRPYCESAMALIENTVRPVYLSKVNIESLDANVAEETKKPLYGIAGLHAGWYDRVEKNKLKLWYWGQLKRWVAYTTATIRSLKQHPALELDMVCEEYCAGCCKCRKPSPSSASSGEKDQSNWRWWHYLIGSPSRTNMVFFSDNF
ncbi:unnamed protein product [Gongylonema pulchrum]|uniref:DAGKc domain-containing protein n=1 Tax=Gongylonema pulchrum TaxID=637853 RepID=A0A183EHG9_9BILA|nr:unnamed protein product [Gongylonema pulchrum]